MKTKEKSDGIKSAMSAKTQSGYLLRFFLVALAIHLFLPLNWGDDSIFNTEAAVGLTEFLKGSSRIFTDTMT